MKEQLHKIVDQFCDGQLTITELFQEMSIAIIFSVTYNGNNVIEGRPHHKWYVGVETKVRE